MLFYGITVFKIVAVKTKLTTIKPTIYLHKYSYPHSNALFVFALKLRYFVPTASTARDIKPDDNQWKVTLRNHVENPTGYRRF